MPRRSTPNPLAQAIGNRVKQLRTEQGVTAEKLAYESDVGSKGFMSDIEHGLALPSLLTLERIAQRLEVSLFDLLVFPERSERDKLADLVRRLPKGPLARLLRELDNAQLVAPTKPPIQLYPLNAYPSLEVAAGWSTKALSRHELNPEIVRLPGRFNKSTDFAVRASGHSMVGFRSLIRDGDWLVLRKQRVGPAAATGQVVLLAREDRYGDKSLHLKRVVQTGRKWCFRSDDPEVKPMTVTEADEILAVLRQIITPESLAPAPHTRFTKSQISDVFGLRPASVAADVRLDGHLFLVVKPGDTKARGMLPPREITPRPAETAFVLESDDESYVYLGLARFDEGKANWRLCASTKSA